MTSSGTSDDQKREAAAALEELPDDQPEDIRAKELAFRRHEQTEEYRLKKQLADAWCAAFVIKKQFREPSREDSVSDITHGRLNKLADGRPLTTDLAAEVDPFQTSTSFFTGTWLSRRCSRRAASRGPGRAPAPSHRGTAEVARLFGEPHQGRNPRRCWFG
jgi:hypothetical protein